MIQDSQDDTKSLYEAHIQQYVEWCMNEHRDLIFKYFGKYWDYGFVNMDEFKKELSERLK